MPSQEHQSIVEMLRANRPLGEGAEALDVEAMRQSMEAMIATIPVPEQTKFEPIDAGGIAAEWSEGPDVDRERGLLYLHGGGYVVGSIATHRALAARIAQAAGIRALTIDYRLAPESPFPAAVEDASRAFRWLVETGISPERIAIGGDSAGGGLTFATLVALRDAGGPLPGAAVALSPWVDLEGVGESMTTRVAVDPLIERKGLQAMAALYLGDADPRTPLAAPLYADLAGLPPTYVQVGTAEALMDDSVRIVARAREAGVAIELETFEDLVHVFQAFAPFVPESVEAVGKLGAFIKASL